MNTHRYGLGLLLAALLLATTSFAGTPRLAQPVGQTTEEPATSYRRYFPLVLNSFSAALFGRVTQAGVAAPGVPVRLRFYNGSAWMTLATVTTASIDLSTRPAWGPGRNTWRPLTTARRRMIAWPGGPPKS